MNNHDLLLSPSSPQSVELIRDFLNNQHSGVLATTSSNNEPHAAVVYFSTDDQLCLTFATKTETQKCKNMEANPKVAFACYDEAQQVTLQIEGRVEKVTDVDTLRGAVRTMHQLSATESHRELPPAEKLYAGDYVCFRLVPQVIKMGIFLRPDSESNEDIFEIVTFSERSNTPNS